MIRRKLMTGVVFEKNNDLYVNVPMFYKVLSPKESYVEFKNKYKISSDILIADEAINMCDKIMDNSYKFIKG